MFLRASMRDPRQATGADRVLIEIATPVQYAAAVVARAISGVWGDYIYLVDVKKESAERAAENAKLRQRVAELEALEAENRRLRRALDLKASVGTEVVTASVLAKNTNEFFRVLRITVDRSSPLIAPNLPVIHPDGVVGTTQKVAGDTVDVRLVVDAAEALDVIVQRTGARGILRGTGDEKEYSCRVQYMERVDEVAIGDKLVTSGIGLRFPKGIDVCTVSRVVKRDFGIYQEVACAPTVDFSRLEEVVVLLDKKPIAQAGGAPAKGP